MSDHKSSLPHTVRATILLMSQSVPLETKSVPEASLPLCVPQLVSRQALMTPHAVAIGAGSALLTYAELEQQANQLAHYLKSIGAGPERLVGLYLKRSPAFIVAALAALKSGAAYLPLESTSMLRHTLLPIRSDDSLHPQPQVGTHQTCYLCL